MKSSSLAKGESQAMYTVGIGGSGCADDEGEDDEDAAGGDADEATFERGCERPASRLSTAARMWTMTVPAWSVIGQRQVTPRYRPRSTHNPCRH